MVVLSLAAMLAWRVFAAEVRDDVTVTWTGPVECEGTTVESIQPRPGGERVQAIRTREGMRCSLPVAISNDSRVSVQITRVRLPFMGPQSGVPAQVRTLDGSLWLRPDSVDAVFRLDRRLEAGETYEFAIDVEFRPPPDGCLSVGSATWLEGQMPQVRVLAFGRPGLRSVDETIAFRGTSDSEC